jgi:hypothetical protein
MFKLKLDDVTDGRFAGGRRWEGGYENESSFNFGACADDRRGVGDRHDSERYDRSRGDCEC